MTNQKTTYTFQDCYAVLEEGKFILGNDLAQRIWDVSGGWPVALSLQNKMTKKEWLDSSQNADWIRGQERRVSFFHEDFAKENVAEPVLAGEM